MRLLKQILPALTRVAILGDAGVPDLLERANQEAAEAEGLRAQVIRLRGAGDDMDAVFAAIRQENAGAVLGLEVPAVFLHTKTIVARATQSKLPTMFAGDWAVFGPMLAYGTSIVEGGRRMAGLVDRILKGAKAGDLPIEVATRRHFTINQRVAREIGLAIPPEVIARADEVIE
jgi:putative ABC transport system substrate-binding protein